jgi:hypothetical protein
VGIIVGAVVTWATGGAAGFISTWYGAATIGAVAGAAGAAANGGNILKGALFGGISSAAFSGAGSLFRGSGAFASLTDGLKYFAQTVVHGAVGGITSVLQGGEFGHGFATAGVAKFFSVGAEKLGMGDTGQFLAATLSGGTASKITGGKFANGATTAALAYAVNQSVSKALEGGSAQKDGNIIPGAPDGSKTTIELRHNLIIKWLGPFSPKHAYVTMKLEPNGFTEVGRRRTS